MLPLQLTNALPDLLASDFWRRQPPWSDEDGQVVRLWPAVGLL
ncbi:hypothetical protein [Sodalis sp.]